MAIRDFFSNIGKRISNALSPKPKQPAHFPTATKPKQTGFFAGSAAKIKEARGRAAEAIRSGIGGFRKSSEKRQRESRIKRAQRESSRGEERTTQLFKAEIRSGNIGEAETRGFYAATRQIWQGQNVENRNELILDYFYGTGDEAHDFQRWALSKGYSLNIRNIFIVEEYVREMNADILKEAAIEGDYPYKAFGLLITYG